jgi:hypothetical protein
MGPLAPFAAVDPLFRAPSYAIVDGLVAVFELNGQVVGIAAQVPEINSGNVGIPQQVILAVAGNGYIAMRAGDPGGGLGYCDVVGCTTLTEIIFTAQGQFIAASYTHQGIGTANQVQQAISAGLSTSSFSNAALGFQSFIAYLNQIMGKL